jgi:TfoX/Sxy family transcriptional regulator of competence genes
LKVPRSDAKTEALFRSVVPDGKGISVKPMFGNVAAFVNGNLFMGLYGNDLLFRLPDEDVEDLLRHGASPFQPVEGRSRMRGYVVAPKAWAGDRKTLQKWADRSLRWAGNLPSKKPRSGARG